MDKAIRLVDKGGGIEDVALQMKVSRYQLAFRIAQRKAAIKQVDY